MSPFAVPAGGIPQRRRFPDIRQKGKPADAELISTAVSMQGGPPYSHFPWACLLCSDGAVFTGCNVENAAYGSTLCAERTALVKAVSEGRTGGFTAIAIAGRGSDFCWPCGACRQMLFEFAPQLRVLAVRGDGAFQSAPLSTLLPCGFGPGSLNF